MDYQGWILILLGTIVVLAGAFIFSLDSYNDPKMMTFKENASSDFRIFVNSGNEYSEPKKVVFFPGDSILPLTIIGNLPIQPIDFAFFCRSFVLCNGFQNALNVQNDKISVNEKSLGIVVYCRNMNRKQNPHYCLGVGRQVNETMLACTSGCGLPHQ